MEHVSTLLSPYPSMVIKMREAEIAEMFGEGVYFARDISYTLQAEYSWPDKMGRRVILVNKEV